MPLARILVADDSRAVRTVVSRTLSKADFEVSLARDGEEAVLLAENNLPDLAILDIQMPGMDGYATCQRILDLSGPEVTVPIVFLTKETANHLHTLGSELGAYLPKPVSDEMLLSTVCELLEREAANDHWEGACR